MQRKMVCVLAAVGDPPDAIAKKLEISRDAVEQILYSKEGVNMTIRLQTALCPDPAQRVKKMANMALDVKYTLMLTAENESVRNAASTDILDRANGKAIAVVENRISGALADVGTIDKQLAAQSERLKKLEEIEKRLSQAKNVSPTSSKTLLRASKTA